MAIRNESFDTQTRIQRVREWLQQAENETETLTIAARVFYINRTSLLYSIEKANNCPQGGLNRILTSSQEQSLHQFIRSYLDHGLLPTKGVLRACLPSSMGAPYL